MSDTDIYRKREPMPFGSGNRSPKRSGRRRRSSSSRRAFDETSRKRRSKNSGLRRLLHLYRKKESEKVFWWCVGTVLVVGLLGLMIWQFVIREHQIRLQEQGDEYMHYQQPLPEETPSSAAE